MSSTPRPLISIFLPVFKTEPYLEQCLRSIKAQTFTDFECVVVNDGSPGMPWSDFEFNQDPDFRHQINISQVPLQAQVETIFRQVVGDDVRFRLISKENGGVASARNAGLNSINGEWLLQIDPDDWVLPIHLANFVQGLESRDLQKFPLVRLILKQFYNIREPIAIYVPKRITAANTIHSNTFCSVALLFNLDLINKYHLRFNERLGRGSKIETRISNGGEDFLFAYRYISAVEQEYGRQGFQIIEVPSDTYRYRGVALDAKQIEDLNGPYQFALFFRPIGVQNPNWDVKLVAWILPFWTRLRFYRNPVAINLRKIISLGLRLITNCY